MNNIFSTIRVLLVFTLLMTSSGIPVVVHSCGGVVESIRVFATTATCGDDAGCEDEGCCSNTVIVSQLNIDATTTASLDIPPVFGLACILPTPDVVLFNPTWRSESSLHSYSLYQRRPPPVLCSMRC